MSHEAHGYITHMSHESHGHITHVLMFGAYFLMYFNITYGFGFGELGSVYSASAHTHMSYESHTHILHTFISCLFDVFQYHMWIRF